MVSVMAFLPVWNIAEYQNKRVMALCICLKFESMSSHDIVLSRFYKRMWSIRLLGMKNQAMQFSPTY